MAIWQLVRRLSIFSQRMRSTVFGNFRSKIWPDCSIWRPGFPIRRVYFHYQMTFAAYIWCFVLNFHIALWPWPMTFWRYRILNVHMYNVHTSYIQSCTTFEHRKIISSWVMDDSIWPHFHFMLRSLRMRRVTWPIIRGGGKYGPHFKNPWPRIVYSLYKFYQTVMLKRFSVTKKLSTQNLLAYLRKVPFRM